ncbi:MAG: ABC transporter ATP-binding protein [Deltaproteobacteria bacterium]|nr:ABC transporter ATP-binding protein [Deltaproteobacteria bacterium]
MIEIRSLSGALGEFNLVDISMTIKDNEYFVLLGPTGAGKTVLIEYLVGIQRQDSGAIMVDGRDITPLYTEERNIAYVPQDYALFPNLSVEKNIAYGLEARRMPRAEIKNVIDRIIERLDIAPIRQRLPFNLSGGEKQRVALGRALATRPRIVLLDEPLSALDENLRSSMARQLRRLQQDSGAIFIHICHNFEEASDVADRIAIMNRGRLEQIGSLEEIKTAPRNEFIARFLKTGNLFSASAEGRCLQSNGIRFQKETQHVGGVFLGIRPENIRLSADGSGAVKGDNTFSGTVVSAVAKPHFKEYVVDIGMPLTVFSIGGASFAPGAGVTVRVAAEHLLVMPRA